MATGKIGAGGRGFGKEGSTVLGKAGVSAPPVAGLVPLQRSSGPYLQNVSSVYLYRLDYCAEAVALFAAMTTPPTTARKQLLNNMIVALKASGAWAKLDCLYVLAAADSQAALLNIKTPGTLTATVVGTTPTFYVNQGFAADVSSGVLDSGFNPATAGGNMTLNSAHIGLWDPFDNALGSNPPIGNLNTTLQNKSSALDTTLSRVGAGGSVSTAGLSTGVLNHYLANRNNSANHDLWGGGTKIATALVSASSALSSLTITMLGRQTAAATYQFTARRMSAFHWGAGLTDAQALSIFNELYKYLHGVGAA